MKLRVLLALAAFMALSFMPAGNADVEGDCTASFGPEPINGRGHDKAADAFDVSKNETVSLTLSALRPVQSYRITVVYGFSEFTLDEDSFPIGVTLRNRTGTFNVAEFADYGSGLYKINSYVEMTDGSSCVVRALVAVDGNPFTTVAGLVAMGVAGAGLAGLIATVVGGYQDAKEVRDSIKDFREAAKAMRQIKN